MRPPEIPSANDLEELVKSDSFALASLQKIETLAPGENQSRHQANSKRLSAINLSHRSNGTALMMKAITHCTRPCSSGFSRYISTTSSKLMKLAPPMLSISWGSIPRVSSRTTEVQSSKKDRSHVVVAASSWIWIMDGYHGSNEKKNMSTSFAFFFLVSCLSLFFL